MIKPGLCTQNTPIHIMVHISFMVKNVKDLYISCMRFLMKYCINDVNCIRLLLLIRELFKFEIQKCGQILCVHKPYFLMPGHICTSLLCFPAFLIGASLSEPHTSESPPQILVLSTRHKKLRQKSDNLRVRREFNGIDYSAFLYGLCNHPCHDK